MKPFFQLSAFLGVTAVLSVASIACSPHQTPSGGGGNSSPIGTSDNDDLIDKAGNGRSTGHKIRKVLKATLVAPDCSAPSGTLPYPSKDAGTFDASNPIRHIVVIMQENHSFDSQLGSLTMEDPKSGTAPSYTLPVEGAAPGPVTVDGLDSSHLHSIPNGEMHCETPQAHYPATCPVMDPDHSWDVQHRNWNGGANDQFVNNNLNPTVMGYFTRADLPYYFWLADTFAIGDRYFCSVLGPTWPNRSFLYAGTSFGILATYQEIPRTTPTHTLFDQLSDSGEFAAKIRASLSTGGISYPAARPLWKYYSDAGGDKYRCKSDGDFIQQLYPEKKYPCAGGSDEFVKDVASGELPLVSFVDADLWGEDESSPGTSEHPGENVQYGQQFVAKVINSVLVSSGPHGIWSNTAIFLTYDENGGFYDHVPPPAACAPDSIKPVTGKTGLTNEPAYAFDRLGFRVPLTVISPYAKRHYVSHVVYDHTSILRFIATKFNLPALTRRDANADAMMDLFDFTRPPGPAPKGAPVARVAACPEPLPNIPKCGVPEVRATASPVPTPDL